MYFTTPAFDSSGRQLAKDIAMEASLANITDGNTVTGLRENFITLCPEVRFIKDAYKTDVGIYQSTGTVLTPSETPATSPGIRNDTCS